MKTQILLMLLTLSVSLSAQMSQEGAPEKCFQSVADVLNNAKEGDPVLLEGVLYNSPTVNMFYLQDGTGTITANVSDPDSPLIHKIVDGEGYIVVAVVRYFFSDKQITINNVCQKL